MFRDPESLNPFFARVPELVNNFPTGIDFRNFCLASVSYVQKSLLEYMFGDSKGTLKFHALNLATFGSCTFIPRDRECYQCIVYSDFKQPFYRKGRYGRNVKDFDHLSIQKKSNVFKAYRKYNKTRIRNSTKRKLSEMKNNQITFRLKFRSPFKENLEDTIASCFEKIHMFTHLETSNYCGYLDSIFHLAETYAPSISGSKSHHSLTVSIIFCVYIVITIQDTTKPIHPQNAIQGGSISIKAVTSFTVYPSNGEHKNKRSLRRDSKSAKPKATR
ncbi:hypothetical protein EDC96DRAFT_550055 [Choanephora cucurbitarum]|nr:hypothetical protein EDC96DRAFT_550055 [Choanephora cucurbitarum]